MSFYKYAYAVRIRVLFSKVSSFYLHFTKNEVFHSGYPQQMWPNPQETEEILNGKLHILCSVKTLLGMKLGMKIVMKNCNDVTKTYWSFLHSNWNDFFTGVV